MQLIGAHVSSAGGCSRAFARGQEIGAEAVQLFLSAPQRWKAPAISSEERQAFQRAAAEARMPAFVHAAYLVNLASPDPALVERSVALLKNQLELCGELGIEGLIFHLGSHLGAGFEAVLPQVAAALRAVTDEASGSARLVIENNAGQGGGVGTTFAEIGELLRAAGGNDRLGLCLDTCHALASGYDLSDAKGVGAMVRELTVEVGLERLAAVHANDSKTPLGSLRDRHENIGDGHIGLGGFAQLLSHPGMGNIPFLLEVPGLAGAGPDVENIMRLKAIRAGTRAAASTS